MEPDALAALKDRQREMWKSFAPTATFTTPVAAHLVQFGHMFAPRPDVAVAEMRRVLKPGGRDRRVRHRRRSGAFSPLLPNGSRASSVRRRLKTG